MKRILLSTLIAIPSLLFSYELDFNKSFSKSIQNDKLNTNINVVIDSKEIEYINEKIEFFQDFISDDTLVTKKNGNYSLLPQYIYVNKKQKFVGYRGSLQYTIETPKYENINQFVSQLNSIKENMNTKQVKVSISNLQWIVSKELYEKNIDEMRIESIKWLKEYIPKLDANCNIKSISLNRNNNYSSRRYMNSAMMESVKSLNITPSQTKQSITLNANYKIECK